MLTSLAPALDPTEKTIHEVETYTQARTLKLIWDAGRRLANQWIPERMMESLPDWEEILKITPAAGSTDNARRTDVAAKLRGFNGNAMVDILAVVQKVLGSNFEDLRTLPREENIVYWPGGIPGPPGFEWMNTAAMLIVEANLNGLNQAAAQSKGAKVVGALNSVIPAWMTFSVGIGDEFIIGEGLVGVTLL